MTNFLERSQQTLGLRRWFSTAKSETKAVCASISARLLLPMLFETDPLLHRSSLDESRAVAALTRNFGRVASSWLILCLTGCASTTIYENGQKVLTTQADATNVTFKTGNGTYFHADALIHSVPTLAGGQATSQVVTSVGAVAVPLVLAAGTGGASTGVQAAAVAASAVPATLLHVQGVVRPTNLYIQNQWVSQAHATPTPHRHKRHHRHNTSPPKDE